MTDFGAMDGTAAGSASATRFGGMAQGMGAMAGNAMYPVLAPSLP